MFRSFTWPADENPFDLLLDSIPLQALSRGRQGNVLVRTDESGDVPIVRTTTPYSLPAQRFRTVHERLAEQIGRSAGITAPFNNALIERYCLRDLAFIYAYTKIHRRPPAEADMQRFFGVTPPCVHRMVLELEKRYLIRREPGRARCIEVLVEPDDLPVLR